MSLKTGELSEKNQVSNPGDSVKISMDELRAFLQAANKAEAYDSLYVMHTDYVRVSDSMVSVLEYHNVQLVKENSKLRKRIGIVSGVSATAGVVVGGLGGYVIGKQ